MSKKESLLKFLKMENTKTERIIPLVALILEALSLLFLISYNKITDYIVFVILIVLVIFLLIVLIFQLKSFDIFFESANIELKVSFESNSTLKLFLRNLNLASVEIVNSNIIFESLKLTIIENSRSLVMNTSKISEKKFSNLNNDLIVFKQIFDRGIENSNDLDFDSFEFNCTFSLEIEDFKIKGDAEKIFSNYPDGLLIIKSQELIKIVYSENYFLRKWKNLRTLIYEK